MGGKSKARGNFGENEHSRTNLVKRILCQLSYNHTCLRVLGIYLHISQIRLLRDSYTLTGLLKTTCPRFSATRWSQRTSFHSSFLPPSPSSFLHFFLPFFLHQIFIESLSCTRHFSGPGDLMVNKTVILFYSKNFTYQRERQARNKKSYWDFCCQHLFDVFFGHQATPDQGALIKICFLAASQ